MASERVKTLILGLLLGLTAGGPAWANPDGPTVVHGQVSIARPNATTLNIINSPGAVINWRSFSIGVDETTRFIQQSAQSGVMNRVVGENPSPVATTGEKTLILRTPPIPTSAPPIGKTNGRVTV